MATLTCPRDGEALTRLDAVLGAGTQGFVCPRCSGVLVDWPTAEKFFTSHAVALADLKTLVGKEALAGKKPQPCPACKENALKPLTLKDTQLDLCEACGHLWFDRGELKRLAGAKAAALPEAPQVLAGETSRSAGTFEMWWDCAHCDTKGLLGKSNRFCPNCGAQQDARRRYFPPDGKEQAFNGSYDGADKQCPACSTPNGAKANNCRHCGSPMDGSAEVGRVADVVTGPPPPRPAASAPTTKRSWWVYAIGVFLALTCCFCGVALTWKKDAKATVSGHRWERSVDVEAYDAVGDSAWCDSMPAGAYNVSRHREQRSTNRVADGETCSMRKVDKGDGTFEKREECKPKYREEPVYADKCTYTIDRWHTVRTARANGSLNDAPRWPSAGLRQTGQCRGCEREGSRHQKYTVELKGSEGESWDCDFDETKWRSLTEGTTRDVKVGVLTGSVDCSSF